MTAAPVAEAGARRPGLDAFVVPGLLLLVAREILDHDPPRVLAWRLLHEPVLDSSATWLAALLPAAPAHDRDPIALVLAALSTLVALLYLGAALAGAGRRARGGLIGGGAFLLVGLPTLAFVALGARTDRPYGQDGGVVQLPLALEKILEGESPYGADYSGTVLARQARASTFWAPLGGNPILRHHAYLPGTHLLMLPGYLASRALFGFFDPRVVTLAFYALAIVLAYRLPDREEARLAAAGVAAFNPLTWWQQVFGANDVVFVAILLGAVLLARRGQGLAAGACLGLACATKQLAWPFAPFVLASLALPAGAAAGTETAGASLRALLDRRSLRRVAGPLIAAAIVFVVVVAPVASLDPAAFYADIVKYNVGLPGDNYPLGGTPGFGFANFLIGYGAVTSLSEYFPFGRFYLLFVPLGLALLARQLRTGRVEGALVAGSAALLASLYFSRVVHPNYLIPAAILLPVAVLALRGPADLALTPLALGALAVTFSEQEVFRSAWDHAVAARVPEVLPALVRAVLPHPHPGLTTDPIGQVLSAVAGGLALVTLVAGALGAGPRGRAALAGAAVLTVVVFPAWLVTTVGTRTGTPRGLDEWVVQAPADAARLARFESPYSPPPPQSPLGRAAWSSSFRLDPPAELRPDHPIVPPGTAMLGALARVPGFLDPRVLIAIAMAALVWTAARVSPALAPSLALIAPVALGSIFGAGPLLTAGSLAFVALLARGGRHRAAGWALGAAFALDFRALAGAPLLAFGDGPLRVRGLKVAGAVAAGVTLPFLLFDAPAFLAAVGSRVSATPGYGLVNLLLYREGPGVGVTLLLKAACVLASGAGAWWLVRRSAGPGESRAVAGFCSLLSLWLDPYPPAGALVLPLLLLALGALDLRARAGSET